jgi:methyl-accepting chemotaxis protein
VRQVDELVSEVTSGSREQAEGITQINRAVGQMDKVTQSNAASAEESAAAAQELSAQAEVMKESVAELLQLVGGRGNVAGQRQAERKREAKPVGGAVRPVKRVTFTGASKNQANGLAHAAFEAAVATAAKPGSAIPMENDFRDF